MGGIKRKGLRNACVPPSPRRIRRKRKSKKDKCEFGWPCYVKRAVHWQIADPFTFPGEKAHVREKAIFNLRVSEYQKEKKNYAQLRKLTKRKY